MKLNFWQWLGVALLILGVVWLIMRELKETPTTKKTSFSAPVQAQASTTPAAVHLPAALF